MSCLLLLSVSKCYHDNSLVHMYVPCLAHCGAQWAFGCVCRGCFFLSVTPEGKLVSITS